MSFEWNAATLLAFFIGIVGGALCQYYWPLGIRKKDGTKTRSKLCPHCGKSLETKE
jgi:hypothetical protein